MAHSLFVEAAKQDFVALQHLYKIYCAETPRPIPCSEKAVKCPFLGFALHQDEDFIKCNGFKP